MTGTACVVGWPTRVTAPPTSGMAVADFGGTVLWRPVVVDALDAHNRAAEAPGLVAVRMGGFRAREGGSARRPDRMPQNSRRGGTFPPCPNRT